MAYRPWATAPLRSMLAFSTHDDLQVAAPVPGLVGGAAAAHAAADDEDVAVFVNGL
jgi:hypothetical protein